MAIEIRVVPRDDVRRWIDTVEAAFADEMSEARWSEFQRILEPERTIAAYDGEQMVGGASTFSFQMTVPGGGQVGAAGVTAVGVLPSHRRRGILNQMMADQLADGRRRGEAAAILWASEGSIYQRYGYGLGALNASIDIEHERGAFRVPSEPQGATRLVTQAEAVAAFPEVYATVQARTPGFYSRSHAWWEAQTLVDGEHLRRGRSRKFYALHQRDGRALAYAVYRVRHDWGEVGTKSILEVQEVVAVDALATREIWRYLFGVDLIARIQAWAGPPDHELLLLMAEPRRLRLRLGDGLWLRLLDVPVALRARSYDGDGHLVLHVEDPFLPDVGGRWQLSVEGGAAHVEPTQADADVELDIGDLAAVYLGGFSFAQLAAAGRTRAATAGAHEVADRMFATSRRPWCPEVF